MNHPNRPLNRSEASAYLLDVHGIKRAPATLAKLASIGGGPAFRKAGRIPQYTPQNLDLYAEEIRLPPIRGEKYEQFMAAADLEAREPAISGNAIAKAISVDHSTIREWRRMKPFKDRVKFVRYADGFWG